VTAFLSYNSDITIETLSGLSPITVAKKGSVTVMQKALIKWLATNKCVSHTLPRGPSIHDDEQNRGDDRESVESTAAESADPQIPEGLKHILNDIKDAFIDDSTAIDPTISLKAAFKRVDKDNNGKLEKAEFIAALSELKVPVGKERVDQLYEHFDAHSNGYILYEEFLAMFSIKSKRTAEDANETSKNRREEFKSHGASHPYLDTPSDPLERKILSLRDQIVQLQVLR